MIETYQMRLQRQARERVEESKRRSRTTRGYGNDFTIADAVDTGYTPSYSPSDGCGSSSSSDSGSCSTND